jgi:hypothetical protein
VVGEDTWREGGGGGHEEGGGGRGEGGGGMGERGGGREGLEEVVFWLLLRRRRGLSSFRCALNLV